MLPGIFFSGLYSGFFGVTGLISSLDFVSDAGFTDSPELVLLGSIVVATADEPSTFASLVFGLVLLALASPRLRRAVIDRITPTHL